MKRCISSFGLECVAIEYSVKAESTVSTHNCNNDPQLWDFTAKLCAASRPRGCWNLLRCRARSPPKHALRQLPIVFDSKAESSSNPFRLPFPLAPPGACFSPGAPRVVGRILEVRETLQVQSTICCCVRCQTRRRRATRVPSG